LKLGIKDCNKKMDKNEKTKRILLIAIMI
jgi:hypothetical protein